jgi:hypothetical protein
MNSENTMPYVLGEHRDELSVDTLQQNRDLALSLAIQARRTLVIVSRNMDPGITNNLEFCTAVRDLALRGKLSRIRMLVSDVEPMVRDGHCLMELTRRLTTFMEIRKQGRDYREYNESFLVVDETGYLYRRFSDRYEGIACFNNKLRARELNRLFQQMWDASVTDPNLKRLHL